MKTIILCSATLGLFQPIEDRIEFKHPEVKVIHVTNYEEVTSLLSDSGPHLVITDSIVAGSDLKSSADGVIFLLDRVKEKHVETKVILYALTILPIETERFDVFIDAIKETGYNDLFKEIEKFCKN
jgi:c-di-AMP phosphodiesterase-like protein